MQRMFEAALRAAVCGCVLIAAACIFDSPASAWEGAHGDPSNSNFIDIPSTPAKTVSAKIANLGTYAPGAAPVVAPDGTVYLGNLEGEVIALHRDGSVAWRRAIGHGQSIVASPAIGADGTIYVIGLKRYTDHRVSPAKEVVESTFHRFTPGGGWLGQTPFPDHHTNVAAAAPPAIWNFGGIEEVVVPAVYSHGNAPGHDVRLIAFDAHGAAMADTLVTSFYPEVTGGWGQSSWRTATCLIPGIGLPLCLPYGFTAPDLPVPEPAPSVAMMSVAAGVRPDVVVSDHMKDVVVYAFDGSNFNEGARDHVNGALLRSAPVALPDRHSVVGTEQLKKTDGAEIPNRKGGAVFAGPSDRRIPSLTDGQAVYATPTRLADGRILLVGLYGTLTLTDGGPATETLTLPGISIASAAASRDHAYVSMSDEFVSYELPAFNEVSRIAWTDGGMSQPVIGPKGDVYALAGNALYIFKMPIQVPIDVGAATQPQRQIVETQPTSQPSSHLYHPPMTANGNRLFACEELDQDDCGQGDYKAISLAFCQKEGFTQADSIDVDSHKVKAETLDGRFCKKNKCKVFDTIDCKM